jgi:phage gpG-like protein
MLQIQVKISGVSEEIERLTRANIALLDYSVALTAVGEELKRYYSNDVFATQGADIGARWPALAASTIKARSGSHTRMIGASVGQPLVLTGKMKESFTAKVTPLSLTIGNSAPYFKYHQSSAPRTKLPRRQMLGINEEVKRIVQTIIAEDVKKKVEII